MKWPHAAASTIVTNDHFVGLERRGDATDVRLASGDAFTTRNEVLVVNRRSSGSDRVHVYNRDVHRVRPDGSLDFGALVGFSGHTNYLLGAILAKHGSPDIFRDLELCARSGRYATPDVNFVFQYITKVYANITSIMPALGMKHYLDRDAYSINATLWYPTVRRFYGFYRLLQSKDLIAEKAKAHLRLLEPGDDQGRAPPGEGDSRSEPGPP